MKLYGFSASNYYNAVKHLLLAKGLDFEEVKEYPSQNEDYLSIHPLGKVPALVTDQGPMSETDIIMEYVDSLSDPKFFPTEAFEKAKCREIMKVAELYIELPARRNNGEVLIGNPRCETAFREARPLMEKGFKALDTLCQPSPYLMGDKMTAADIFVRYALVVGNMVAAKVYDWKPLDEYPALKAWSKMMREDAVSQKVDQDSQAAMQDLMEYFAQFKK
ncbi:glutathione S-transferase family protein [Pseudoteredinibacter isoporae]|uniref:Glutathione S-transferase n=1 Tax=Pseudoteredinibacter isoporae TaxID=570281 RepID=A0A7X0JT74_9GAMM|nr:glutathione S-transferase family protein [Pseudoteredinibacter isoporae]MBB6521799.1 glutathione S-transferase [Pseudoteredinibacter isoporae]NHO87344.1 glutathione S-transferase family protein [Pseudoteredinibacter isoporae]NIB23168.1 glutathione S-transferase family protein [Pseudoteredinibacter isoporae]